MANKIKIKLHESDVVSKMNNLVRWGVFCKQKSLEDFIDFIQDVKYGNQPPVKGIDMYDFDNDFWKVLKAFGEAKGQGV